MEGAMVLTSTMILRLGCHNRLLLPTAEQSRFSPRSDMHVAIRCFLPFRWDLPMLPLKPRLTLCFLPAGMFSGLASHVVSTRVLFPRLVARASTQASIKVSPAASAVAGATTAATTATSREILPSLGASGAVYAAVTLSALAFPDAEVRLLFLPVFPIPIIQGVGGLILLDVVGVIRGWR